MLLLKLLMKNIVQNKSETSVLLFNKQLNLKNEINHIDIYVLIDSFFLLIYKNGIFLQNFQNIVEECFNECQII